MKNSLDFKIQFSGMFCMSFVNCFAARFDGVPTEMASMIGDNNRTNSWEGKCGTDYTVDFLFGFAGYDHRKITDAAVYKNEIIASIDAGKPVIAECTIDNGAFRIITGYDSDTLINDYFPIGQQLDDTPMVAPSYDELKVLYIIGDKITPRYTLKDGLKRIKRVMENNISEKIWDISIKEITKCLISPTDDEFEQINPDDIENAQKSRYRNHDQPFQQ